MKKPVISPEQALTFSDYFRLNIYVGDAAQYFGYTYETTDLTLPSAQGELPDLSDLRKTLERNILRVDLTSEIARREFLIAQILAKILELTDTKIRTEYPLEISHQLKGTFDYLLRAKNNFLLIEAKNGDLKRGFTQLAVEMIAFDKAGESEQEILYGAISIGDVWRFGKMNRAQKQIFEDINLFRIPADLRNLMQTLVGILEEV